MRQLECFQKLYCILRYLQTAGGVFEITSLGSIRSSSWFVDYQSRQDTKQLIYVAPILAVVCWLKSFRFCMEMLRMPMWPFLWSPLWQDPTDDTTTNNTEFRCMRSAHFIAKLAISRQAPFWEGTAVWNSSRESIHKKSWLNLNRNYSNLILRKCRPCINPAGSFGYCVPHELNHNIVNGLMRCKAQPTDFASSDDISEILWEHSRSTPTDTNSTWCYIYVYTLYWVASKIYTNSNSIPGDNLHPRHGFRVGVRPLVDPPGFQWHVLHVRQCISLTGVSGPYRGGSQVPLRGFGSQRWPVAARGQRFQHVCLPFPREIREAMASCYAIWATSGRSWWRAVAVAEQNMAKVLKTEGGAWYANLYTWLLLTQETTRHDWLMWYGAQSGLDRMIQATSCLLTLAIRLLVCWSNQILAKHFDTAQI